MKIVFGVILSGVLLLTVTSLQQEYGQSQAQVGEYQVKIDRLRATQEAARLIRTAWDVGESIRQSTTLGVSCPSGTIQHSVGSSGQFLCWPTSNRSLCLDTLNGYFICPKVNTSGLPAIELAGQSFKNWIPSLLPKAFAAPVGSYITARTPENMSSIGTNVRVNTPSCGGVTPSNYCIRCADSNTHCLTMTFCVERDRVTDCTAGREVTQTFVIRE